MLPQNPSLNLRIGENIISHSKKVAGKMQPILNKINTLGKRSSLKFFATFLMFSSLKHEPLLSIQLEFLVKKCFIWYIISNNFLAFTIRVVFPKYFCWDYLQ